MIKLITLLVGGIPALIAAILASFGRKWVTLAAAIAAYVGVTVAFIAVINTIVGAIAITSPGYFANAIGMFVPSNFGACLGSIIGAHIGRAAYDLAVGKIKLFNAAT